MPNAALLLGGDITGRRGSWAIEPFDLGAVGFESVEPFDILAAAAELTSVEPFWIDGPASFTSVEPFDLGPFATLTSVEPFDILDATTIVHDPVDIGQGPTSAEAEPELGYWVPDDDAFEDLGTIVTD